VKTTEHFHKYLCGQEFHLRTDHSALTWMLSFKNLEGQTPAGFGASKSTTSNPSIVREASTPKRMYCQRRHVQRNEPIARRSNNGQVILECVIVAAAEDGWDRIAQRKEHLNDQHLGQILQEMEAIQLPDWKDIADRSPIYKSY
jgi:hypothetical protein